MPTQNITPASSPTQPRIQPLAFSTSATEARTHQQPFIISEGGDKMGACGNDDNGGRRDGWYSSPSHPPIWLGVEGGVVWGLGVGRWGGGDRKVFLLEKMISLRILI